MVHAEGRVIALAMRVVQWGFMWLPVAAMIAVVVLGAVVANRRGGLRGWPLVVVLTAFGFPWQILAGVALGRVLQRMVATHWHAAAMPLGRFVAIAGTVSPFIGALPVLAAAVYGLLLLRRGAPPAGGASQSATVEGGVRAAGARVASHRANPDRGPSSHKLGA